LTVYRRPRPRNPIGLFPTIEERQAVVPMPGEGIIPQLWTTSILSAACGRMLVAHPLVDGDDVDCVGALIVIPTLNLPSNGVLRCAPIDVQIVPLVGLCV